MAPISFADFLKRRQQGESVEQITKSSLAGNDKQETEKTDRDKYIEQFSSKSTTQASKDFDQIRRFASTGVNYSGGNTNRGAYNTYEASLNRSGKLTPQQRDNALRKGQDPNYLANRLQEQYALYDMQRRNGALGQHQKITGEKESIEAARKHYQDTKQTLADAQTSKKDARQNYADMLIKRDNMRSQYEEMLEDYNQRLQNGETEEDLADYYAAVQDKLNKANVYDQQVTNAYDELKNARSEARTASSENAKARDTFNAYSAKFGENAAKEQAAGTAMQNAYDSAPGRVSTLQNGEYANILQRPDYAAMSQAGESKNNLSGRYDATYDYINDINGQRGITKLNALQGRGGGDLGKYDFMTKDEVGVYNYLYATEGKKSAEQFLKSLDIDLNAQYQGWSSNVVADVADDNAAAGTLFSLGTAVMAPARGITGAAAMAQDMYRTVTGQEIDPNSSLRRLSQNTNAVRESVSDSIRQSAPGKIGGVGSFLYNVGMSAADSAVNMLTAQGVVGALGYAGDAALKATNILSSATMSSEVASMSVAESKEKGYSDAGAMSLGLIRGGIEYLSEKLGGEWVIKRVKENPTSLFNTLIRSMIPEGIEENMSDVGNETVNVISDLLFGTDESWLRTTYNAYKANGSKNPFLDTAISAVIQEVLSFSGGALASVGNASVQFAGYKSSIKAGADALHASESDVVKIMEKYDIKNPRAVKLIAELTDSDSVKSFDEAMSAYENAQEVVDEAMRLSGQRNGSFLREAGIGSVENQVDSAWDVLTGKVTAEESQQKAQTAMKALGLSQSQQRAAEGSNKYVAANATISQKETATVFEAAQKKLEAEGIKDERLAGAITAAALNESAKQQDASGAPEPTKLQQKLIDDSPVAQKLVRELAAESVQRAAETVVSEEDLQNVKYDGGSAEIVSVGKNGVQIRTADGTEKTVPVERLEVSGGYGALLDAAAGMENGNEMLRAYKPGQNVAKYISAWQSAETLIGAKTNYTMEQARQAYPALYKTLTDSQLIRAIEAGRETKAENEKKAKAESEQYGKLREEAKQKVKEGKDKRTEGKVKLDGVDEKKLNKQQKKVYNMVKAVAKVLNFDFELYDGEKTTGGVYIQGGKIRVNINSGAYTGKYIGAATLAHEITHALQGYDKQGYAEFTDFITNEVLTPDELARLVNIQLNLEPDLTPGEALDEVIANGCAKMLLNNEAIRKLAEQNRSLFGWIKDKIDEITGNINDAYDEIDLSDDLDVYKAARIFERSFDEIRERWNKMLETANENKAAEKITGKKISADGGIKFQNQKLSDNEFMAEGGDTTLDYDADTDSVNIQFHRLTWEASDYVTERDKAAKEIAAKLGVTQKRAKEYIDAVNSVSKYIAENKGRLDYEDTGLSPFVGNVEYGGSFDFTTLCDKRRLYTGTFSAIQRALPNTALTAIEMLKLRAMMDAAGLKVPCGKCYVEGSRASMGVYTQKFIELYKKYHPGTWAPNMAQMNTPDGIEWVRNNHPEVYEQYEYFWNHYGTLRQGDPNLFASQQKPKLYQMRSAYKGEILKHFKSDSSIEEKNKNGGVRLQSFSDFEMAHLLDAMQVIMDMSRVGLAGQAYTKIPNFAWALGRTGLKINLSIDAWDVVDGKLVFNNKEGMNFDEAMRIRDANSKNVGTICCVYDDAQLLAAMADPRIDFIIPFHRSQWKKSQYKAMGLPATTKDYTYQQNEKWLHPLEHTHEYRGRQVKDRCTNYMPNEYWDFSKSGKENAEEYLRMCARDGKRPKFYKFLTNNGDGSYSLKEDGSTDGYWKLLIDFKMYDNDGKGSPQMPVQPTFNMAEVERMLESYEGGHNTFPTAQGVVDEFVEWYKEQHPGREQYQKLGFNETEEEQQARKESFDNLKAENRILRARAEYWKAQTRQTKERTVRQQDTDRLANELLRKYESKADKAEVKEAIKALGDWLVQTDELDYDELKAKAEAIAEDIISGNYVLLDNSQQEQLDRLKDYLKSTPVNLTKSDFNDTGDENFRKRYGRYFTVSENGRTIDSLWGELAATFGEGVFPEDTYAPGDMLNMIADYLDMWKPQYGSEFEMYHGEAVNAVTNEIIDAILSEEVRQTPATYADKAQQKLNAQIAKDKAKLDALREAKNARIEELKRQASEKNAQIRMAEKASKYEAVSKVKQHYQDMLKRQRNKRSDTAVRAKIKKLHKELTDILLKPKEGRYVPRELVKATAEILGAIDTTSGRAVKAKAAMAELKVKYDALAKDTKYALTYDETVSGMIQELAENIGDGSIYDLTGTELESVYNTLKALKHTIVTANKLVGAKIEADAFEAANQMMRETESAKGVPTKTLRRFVLAQMTPSSAFRMFGGYAKNSMWEQMFNELNNGQLTQTQILMEGGQIFRELIDDKKNLKRLHDQKSLVDIGLKDDQGNAIKVTRGMMLSVYMHLQNEQNAKHVAYGGLTVPRLAQYYKNQMKDAFNGKTGRAVAFAAEIADLNRQLSEAETAEEQNEIKERLAELNDQTDAYMSDLRAKIEDQLTDYDRKWIAAAQQFFDVYSKGKLNEVTEMVYGFEKAQVDNYFPIHTDPNYRAASFDTIARDMSLENAGFMKERVNGANPILLEDITDVISSQLRRTAQYCGLMPAIRNFNKVYGKARAGYSMSVQSAMARTFENEGKKYIENLMADLNGARKTEPNIFDELRGNMAGAVLTLNPRVTLAQAASFPSAAAEIGYKPLMKALTDMKNPMWDKGLTEEIAKWTPLWWYRMQGYSTAELGDIKTNEQLMNKVMDKMKWATGWIQAADGLTTGGLWQASKYYVDENFSDLKKGSDEYMMKVAEVYNRVLEKTQPDYTTMQRPDILRNPNAIVKQLTMFMTQRLQNTNILYDAAATYAHYVRDADAGRNDVTAADVKQARTRLVWAVSSQVAASATIVIFKALADAIMHNLKAYRDDDDELTTESVVKTLLTNFAETISGNILWGSEMFSWMKSAFTGERYYGISLNGVDTFADTLSDANQMVQKAVKGDREGSLKAGGKLAKAVAQFFGVPLGNAEKIAQMARNYIEDAQNGTFMEAGVDRTRAQNTHILFNALQTGDTAKAERIRAEFKDQKDEQAALKGYIKELYTRGDQQIQKDETISLLQKYGGMTKRDAEDAAQQWTMEVVTGTKYSDLQDAYISGDIPRAQAEKYYKTYSSNGRTTQAEAAAKVNEWTCEKETGIAYGDIGSEVKTGRLSTDKAVQMLVKYGGKSQSAAQKTVNGYAIEHQYNIKPSELEDEYLAGHVSDQTALDILKRYKYYGKEDAGTKAAEDLERMKFVRSNPNTEDISITQVRNYNASGLKGYVSAADYTQAAKMMGTFKGTDNDNDGKTDSYSVAIQKLEYIDTFDLTSDQKTALAVALGINEKTVRRKAPWR